MKGPWNTQGAAEHPQGAVPPRLPGPHTQPPAQAYWRQRIAPVGASHAGRTAAPISPEDLSEMQIRRPPGLTK